MNENFRQSSRSSRAIFSVGALSKVNDAGPNSKSPTVVSKTVIRSVEWEVGDIGGFRTITDKAAGSVRVQSEHEEECKMVGVPKHLERLLSDLLMSSGVHEEHDEKHEVARETASLGVMNLEGYLLANLYFMGISKEKHKGRDELTGTLDIEEIDVVSCGMDHSPESHRICDLSMEPDILVGREEPGDLGANDTNDIAQHRNKNKTAIES